MKRILYTAPSGGVEICTPAAECLAWLQSGGHWGITPRGFLATQIERGIDEGRNPDAQRRFVYGLAFGGLSEAEAFAAVRDRDCLHKGTAHELITDDDLPGRAFRNAWVRSHNGGPISIDLGKARLIHWQRLRAHVETENAARRESLTPRRLLKPNWGVIRDAIHQAQDIEDLQRIGV